MNEHTPKHIDAHLCIHLHSQWRVWCRWSNALRSVRLTTWARQQASLQRCIQRRDYLWAPGINISPQTARSKRRLEYFHLKLYTSTAGQELITAAYLWEPESLKEESAAAWRSMTLDLRRWRRSCSSSLPGKAASSGVLQPAGDRPLFFREDDDQPGRTRETGVEAALILAGDTQRLLITQKHDSSCF